MSKENKENNQVLYRKYRPSGFGEVLGQESIVETIKNSIKNKKISHAYLFSGGRGTGKTSVARIFAKEIGVSSDDLYEIDAASNNSVDEIRILSESVHTLPFNSPYKVYILDEVHMLSKSAFNAFLKTLEEPPAHVIFILATTEIEKIPDTIISRSEIYEFKKPTREILSKMALDVAKKEGIKIDKNACDLIALIGDGSYRDTHGALQKIISFSKGNEITRELVEEVAGLPSDKAIFNIIKLAVEGKGVEALENFFVLLKKDVDLDYANKFFVNILRSTLLARIAPSVLEDEYRPEEIKDFVELSKNPVINSVFVREILTILENTKSADTKSIGIELALAYIGEKASK